MLPWLLLRPAMAWVEVAIVAVPNHFELFRAFIPVRDVLRVVASTVLGRARSPPLQSV